MKLRVLPQQQIKKAYTGRDLMFKKKKKQQWFCRRSNQQVFPAGECICRYRFTFSGHLGQQLVCQLLWEENSLSEAQRAIGALRTETLQILAHVSQAQICQRRGRRIILGRKQGQMFVDGCCLNQRHSPVW